MERPSRPSRTRSSGSLPGVDISGKKPVARPRRIHSLTPGGRSSSSPICSKKKSAQLARRESKRKPSRERRRQQEEENDRRERPKSLKDVFGGDYLGPSQHSIDPALMIEHMKTIQMLEEWVKTKTAPDPLKFDQSLKENGRLPVCN